MTATANERALRASRFFSLLDGKLVERLAKTIVRRRFARGEHLWRAGDPALAFFVIASGLVEIARKNPDGSSAIVAIFGPREPIGASAVVARGAYPADAIAATPVVEVLQVESAPVLDASRTDPRVAEAIHAALLEHTEALQEKIRIMTAGSVPQRLATLVLHLIDRFGDELEDGSTHVPVALSRSELARLVGATVETTIRTVSAWQKDGVIDTQKDGFLVKDPKKLAAIAAGGQALEG